MFFFFNCRNEIRSGTLETSPSIGLVVSQLRNCVEYYNREKQTYDGLLRQRNSLPTISLDAKSKADTFFSHIFLNLNVFFCFADQIEFESLTEKLTHKNGELKLCTFLTEHCLYLLWAHLDFYMLRAVSVNSLQFNQSEYSFDQFFNNHLLIVFYLIAISTSLDAGWKVTSEDVSSLKKSLIQILNETFCKQLIDTTQVSDLHFYLKNF